MTNKSNFDEIARQAASLVKEISKPDYAAAAFGLLLGFGPAALEAKDYSKAKEVAVPDEWLTSVAALPTITRRGLELLADALKEKGWVSVFDAHQFVEIEKAAITEAAAHYPCSEEVKEIPKGAALLLARAEKDLPGTIQRFAEGARDFAEAAGGVASFAAEKTIWVGKGLGVIAEAMRNMRKA